MIHNEAALIAEKLGALDGVCSVTRGWPKRMECLPCIALQKASDTPVSFKDDREHIAQLEYYIRVFAAKAAQVDVLAAAVDAAMEELGYTRTFAYDDDSQAVRMAALRYRKYV